MSPDGTGAAAARDRTAGPRLPEVGSSWLDDVHRAMRLPPTEGRALLDDMIAQRQQRAAELRARVSAESDDARQQRVFALMAAWVDDSIGLLEGARAHLGTRAGAPTPRGVAERSTRARPSRDPGRSSG